MRLHVIDIFNSTIKIGAKHLIVYAIYLQILQYPFRILLH